MKDKKIIPLIMCLILVMTGCNKSETVEPGSEDTTTETTISESSVGEDNSGYILELKDAIDLINSMSVNTINWEAFRLVEATYQEGYEADVYEYLMTLKDGHTYGSLLAYYPYPDYIYGKTVFTNGFAYTYEEVKGNEVPGEYFEEDYDGVTTYMYYLESISSDINSEISLLNNIYKGENSYYTYIENEVKNHEVCVILSYQYSYFNEDYYQTYTIEGIETITIKSDNDNVLSYLYIQQCEDEFNSKGTKETTYYHDLLFEKKEGNEISLPSWFEEDDRFYYGYYQESESFTSIEEAVKGLEDLNLETPNFDAYLLNHMSSFDYQVGSKNMKTDEEGYLIPGEYDISEDYRRVMYDITYTYYLQKDESGNTYGRSNYYYSSLNDEGDQSSSLNTQTRYAYLGGYRYARYTDESLTEWDMDNPEVCDNEGSTLYDALLNEVLDTVKEAIETLKDETNYEGSSWKASIVEGKCEKGEYKSKSISYEIDKDNGDTLQLSLVYDRFGELDSLFYYSLKYNDNYYTRDQISLSWLDPYDAGLPTGFEGSWY